MSPRRRVKSKRVLFRDELGRFVAEADRYQKAVSVQRFVKGRYMTVTQDWRDLPVKKRRLTPKRLVDILNQDEFESLPSTFGGGRDITPTARKYVAWDLAQKAMKARGLRGKAVRVTMEIKDGDATRFISFIHQFRRKGAKPYGLFTHMNEAIGNAGGFFYNKIRSKLLSDRKGRQMHLKGIKLEPEL